MTLVARLAATLAILLAFAAPALGQEVSEAQKQALGDRIASFDTAMRANDVAGIMSVVPPPVLEKIAATYGASVEQVIEATQQQMDQIMADVTFESFSMDLAAAEYTTLPDGTIYALVPTETVIDLGKEYGGKMRAKSSTLALLDGETWYLIRVDDAQQVQMLKEVYPALVGIEFPQGTTEAVTE